MFVVGDADGVGGVDGATGIEWKKAGIFTSNPMIVLMIESAISNRHCDRVTWFDFKNSMSARIESIMALFLPENSGASELSLIETPSVFA